MTSSLRSGCEERCPGCRYRALSPAESDQKKQAWAEQNLAAFTARFSPLRSPSARWGYRRKVLLHAGQGPEGWNFGLLRRRGRETELIAIPHCPLHAAGINGMLATLRALLPKDLPLAFVFASGPCLTLVLKAPASAAWRDWAKSLEDKLRAAGVEGLQVNWHPSAGRRVFSSRHQERIFGEEFFHEGNLAHGALSFRQQIPELEEEALGLAEEFLAGAQASSVADLYCGAGATLARWRRRNWRAVGVELGGEALRAAQRNAPGALLLPGRVEHRLPQLDSFLGREEPFVLYTNPPRGGHASEVNEWILRARPLRFAYLSCNQRSLARDLEALGAAYEIQRVQPFDFFPQTDHVEALALGELRLTERLL